MLDTLAHRGPDGRGTQSFGNGRVILGHRRLAIIDLGPHGKQPISNEDQTVWLTFNGEIYNYQSLRKELSSLGHHFHSQTDSEAIVHAYEEWGSDCVTHLRGIFAFGIWDNTKQQLFLARDHLGVKPLYYAHYAGRFTFASQPKAILADPLFKREIDPHGFRDFLAFGFIPRDRSAFSGMSKLPAGHTAILSDNKLKLHQYWQLEYRPDFNDSREAIVRLHEGLAEAVQAQLVSDLPVGCFLSGGIDSSLLVSLARPHLSELRTFTVGFDDAGSDEREHARLIAAHFGTNHHERVATRQHLKQRLCNMQEFFDEPFDPNGPLPFLEVAQLARQQKTTVSLGGDGADELFAGYLRYDDFDRPAWLPSGKPTTWWRKFRHWGLLGARGSAIGDLDRYFSYEGCLTDAAQHPLMDDNFTAQLNDDAAAAMRSSYRPDLPAVAAAQFMDMHLYLIDHILCKVDRASMAYGVEARVPFLDIELVKLAFQIPLALQYRHGERKALLKQVAAKLLPAEVITSRKKGFSSPMEQWFDSHLDPWMNSWMAGGQLVQSGILRRDWAQQLAALRASQPHIGQRTQWLMLTAELWARRWIGGETISTTDESGPHH